MSYRDLGELDPLEIELDGDGDDLDAALREAGLSAGVEDPLDGALAEAGLTPAPTAPSGPPASSRPTPTRPRPEPPTRPFTATDAGRHAAQGAMMGYSDEVRGSAVGRPERDWAGTAREATRSVLLGGAGPLAGVVRDAYQTLVPDAGTYSQERDAERRALAESADEHPYQAAASQIGGAAGGAVTGLGSGFLGSLGLGAISGIGSNERVEDLPYDTAVGAGLGGAGYVAGRAVAAIPAAGRLVARGGHWAARRMPWVGPVIQALENPASQALSNVRGRMRAMSIGNEPIAPVPPRPPRTPVGQPPAPPWDPTPPTVPPNPLEAATLQAPDVPPSQPRPLPRDPAPESLEALAAQAPPRPTVRPGPQRVVDMRPPEQRWVDGPDGGRFEVVPGNVDDAFTRGATEAAPANPGAIRRAAEAAAGPSPRPGHYTQEEKDFLVAEIQAAIANPQHPRSARFDQLVAEPEIPPDRRSLDLADVLEMMTPAQQARLRSSPLLVDPSTGPRPLFPEWWGQPDPPPPTAINVADTIPPPGRARAAAPTAPEPPPAAPAAPEPPRLQLRPGNPGMRGPHGTIPPDPMIQRLGAIRAAVRDNPAGLPPELVAAVESGDQMAVIRADAAAQATSPEYRALAASFGFVPQR